MPMNKHTLTLSYKSEGGSIPVKVEDIEGDLSINLERVGLVAGSTNNRFTLGSIPTASIKGFAFGIKKTAGQVGDKNAEATFKTNSTSAPTNTFAGLTPTQGIAWTILDITHVNPLTGTITDIYVDVTGTANVDVIGRLLVDSTPALPD